MAARRSPPELGRLLAHWEEFVAYRKEMKLKIEDIWTELVLQRDCEAKCSRACENLEAKVDTCSLQAQKLAQWVGKMLEQAAVESQERFQQIMEALQSGDRSIVDELTNRLAGLEDETKKELLNLKTRVDEAKDLCETVTTREVRKLKTHVDEVKHLCEAGQQLSIASMAQFDADIKGSLAETRASLEASIVKARDDLSLDMQQAYSEHEKLLADLDAQAGALAERLRKVEVCSSGTAAEAEQFRNQLAKVESLVERLHKVEVCSSETASKAEQFRNDLAELTSNTSVNLLRARGELESYAREAVRKLREDFTVNLQSLRESACRQHDFKAFKDESRADLTKCSARTECLENETRLAFERIKTELEAANRKLAVSLQTLQQQLEIKSETSVAFELGLQRWREKSESAVDELKQSLGTCHEEIREIRKSFYGTSEQVYALGEAHTGLQDRISEACLALSKTQNIAQNVMKETAHLRSHIDTRAAETRKTVCTEVIGTLERQIKEDVHEQIHALRNETFERNAMVQKEVKEATKQLKLEWKLAGEERLDAGLSMAQHQHLKRELDTMTTTIDDRVATASSSTRKLISELRQDVHRLIKDQLEERLQPLSEVISDLLADRRALPTSTDVMFKQKKPADFSDLRAEMRAMLMPSAAVNGEDCRSSEASKGSDWRTVFETAVSSAPSSRYAETSDTKHQKVPNGSTGRENSPGSASASCRSAPLSRSSSRLSPWRDSPGGDTVPAMNEYG